MPRFVLCSCRKHGRIVFDDGRLSGEIGSVEESLTILHYAALIDAFQEVDVFPQGSDLRKIADEIASSGLPLTEDEVGNHTWKVLTTWNTAKLIQPNLNPVCFDRIDYRLWHYRAYDS